MTSQSHTKPAVSNAARDQISKTRNKNIRDSTNHLFYPHSYRNITELHAVVLTMQLNITESHAVVLTTQLNITELHAVVLTTQLNITELHAVVLTTQLNSFQC
jgi:hypothetical protein